MLAGDDELGGAAEDVTGADIVVREKAAGNRGKKRRETGERYVKEGQ